MVRQIAGEFPAAKYPNVLVGLGEPDDAAVIRLDDERALIQTTDFFTPIVDDPWTYGAIAAANAMSDVYAMGGEVITCLNIAGFPEGLDAETVSRIFAGGAAKVREAGAVIAGGHTVTNPEPFYGLSVTGLIHPDRVTRKGGLTPGDRLYLTKPLGTGVVTTAAKLTGAGENRALRLARRAQGKPDLDPAHLDAGVDSMLRLNRAAAQAGQIANARGATDITGFGLLGHASEMAQRSAKFGICGLRIVAEDVPALPGVWSYIEAGYLTRGSTRNPAHFANLADCTISFAAHVSPAQRTLLWEAETSGGLLLAISAEATGRFEQACAERAQNCWAIGEVVERAGLSVV